MLVVLIRVRVVRVLIVVLDCWPVALAALLIASGAVVLVLSSARHPKNRAGEVR